jgi:hypothetical protein
MLIRNGGEGDSAYGFQQDSHFLEFWLIMSDVVESTKFSLSIEKS